MTPVLLVPPIGEPVSLTDAKAWLRIDTNDEDALVTSLITAARGTLEAATRRLFITQTWRLSFDASPAYGIASPFNFVGSLTGPTLAIALAPVTSIVALRVYDAGDVPQIIDPATYRLGGAPDSAKIVSTSSPPPPGRAVAGIELDVVAGYGAATDVPQPLRQAMLMLVARWFENRGDGGDRDASVLPPAVTAMIAPFRRPSLL